MTFRPFIRFNAVGEKVVVEINTMLYVERCAYQLDITGLGQIGAELLASHLTDVRQQIMEAAVTKAYADGYRDGRAKRGQRTWHDSRLGRDA